MHSFLPDELKEFVDAQVAERGCANSSEYVRDLILHDQGRTQLRVLLADGMGSGPEPELDGEYFERMRERIRSADIS